MTTFIFLLWHMYGHKGIVVQWFIGSTHPSKGKHIFMLPTV